jgi:hypothetical protein
VKRTLCAAALTWLGLGCGLVQFDVQESGAAQVPGCIGITCLLGQFGFAGFGSMDLSQSQQWQENNANRSEVSSVMLTSAVLDVTVPDGGDMSFLQQLQFFVSAPDSGTPALVAQGNSFPAGQSQVSLMPQPGVELSPYVKAPSMTLTTDAQGSQPSQNTTIQASVTFHVKL